MSTSKTATPPPPYRGSIRENNANNVTNSKKESSIPFPDFEDITKYIAKWLGKT